MTTWRLYGPATSQWALRPHWNGKEKCYSCYSTRPPLRCKTKQNQLSATASVALIASRLPRGGERFLKKGDRCKEHRQASEDLLQGSLWRKDKSAEATGTLHLILLPAVQADTPPARVSVFLPDLSALASSTPFLSAVLPPSLAFANLQ